MNDKIKELARKAGGNPNYKAYKDYFMPPPPNHIDPSTVNLEKFAELIVRECIEIVEASKVGFSQVPAEVALDLTAKNINSYFGIKDA